MAEQRDDVAVNEVRLRGRISGGAEQRELPSGDTIVVARLVVRHPPDRTSRVTHDTFDLVAWRAPAARSLLASVDGQVVELTGRLRRRFWRSGGAPASRCEVEVLQLRRARTSPRSARAPRRAVAG